MPQTTLQNRQENGTLISERNRALAYGVRQGLIIILGAIEDWLGIEHSIIPRHKRKQIASHESDATSGTE